MRSLPDRERLGADVGDAPARVGDDDPDRQHLQHGAQPAALEVERKALVAQLVHRREAGGVDATEDHRAPGGGAAEEDDGGGDQERRAELRVVELRALAGQAQQAEHGGDQDGRGQQASRDLTAEPGARQQSSEPAIAPGEDHPGAQEQRGDARGQRHGRGAREPVELGDLIEVAEQTQEADEPGRQRGHLVDRPARSPQVDRQQRGAEQHHRQGRVGRDPAQRRDGLATRRVPDPGGGRDPGP